MPGSYNTGMSKKQTVPKRHTNQCKQCGRSFKTNHPESATCSRGCRTLYFKRFVEDDDIFTSLGASARSYILGLIAADGCVYLDKASGRRRVNLTSKDEELIRTIHGLLHTANSRAIYHGGGAYSFNYINDSAISRLISYGISERKSLSLRLSASLIDDVVVSDFIRGVFDGDGSVYVSRRYRDKVYLGVSITSGSKEFLEELSLLLEWHLGISAKVYKDSRQDHSAYYLRIGKSRDIAQFRDFICSGRSVQLGLVLDRKRSVFKIADDVL